MHWFLVANQEEIRIFVSPPGETHLQLLRTIANPLGKTPRRELIRKEAGQGLRSLGHVGTARYTEGLPHDPRENASHQFAREVGRLLELERQRKEFSSLTVTAEPRFLGKLRSEFGQALQKTIVEWIPKDLQKMRRRQLEEAFATSREKNAQL